MSISTADLAKLQNQARLTLDTSEQKSIPPQLNEALEAIKVFDELPTQNVQPLAQPIASLHNVWREDNVRASLTQEQALSQGNAHLGYFLVPNVFTEPEE